MCIAGTVFCLSLVFLSELYFFFSPLEHTGTVTLEADMRDVAGEGVGFNMWSAIIL